MCVASCSTYWGYGGEQGPSLPGPVFHRRRLAVSNVTGMEKWPEGKEVSGEKMMGCWWVGWSLRSDLWNEGVCLQSWKREECSRKREQEAQMVSTPGTRSGEAG